MHSYVNHKNLKKALLTNYLSKMKKGLLSLLAVALTVVGCQNYDDQFDELSDQITALSATVQGLSTVADQITALQNTVNGLELTLGADIATIKTANKPTQAIHLYFFIQPEINVAAVAINIIDRASPKTNK